MAQPLPEVWLRGPVEGIQPLLQPVVHALLQAAEEAGTLMTDLPEHLLWERPAGCASPGFHLLHIAGVLDRLCTYALAKPLSEKQLKYLAEETIPLHQTSEELLHQLKQKVTAMIEQIKATTEASLLQERAVGRKALPSTVLGLLFHAAEHTMRHLGQLLVTVRVLKDADNGKRK